MFWCKAASKDSNFASLMHEKGYFESDLEKILLLLFDFFGLTKCLENKSNSRENNSSF